MNIKTTILAGATILAAVTGTQAKGLLGVNYVEASVGYATLEAFGANLDFLNYGVGINHNVVYERDYGFDLGFNFNWTEDNEDLFNAESMTLSASVTAFYLLNDTVTPFVRGSLGYNEIDLSAGGFSGDDDSLVGTISVGAQLELLENLTVTPSIGYFEFFSYDDVDDVVFSVDVSYWLSEHFSLGASYSVTEIEDVDVDFFRVALRMAY